MDIKQSESTAQYKTIYLNAVQTADGLGYTGTLSGSDILVTKAGGALAASTGTATHLGSGLFKYVIATAELDTIGECAAQLAKAGLYNDVRVWTVVPWNPMSGSNLGLSNIDTTISSRSSHTVANILDLADGIETDVTPRQALRLLLAIIAGLTTGAGTGSESFRAAVSNSKVRATTTMTGANRTGIVYDLD